MGQRYVNKRYIGPQPPATSPEGSVLAFVPFSRKGKRCVCTHHAIVGCLQRCPRVSTSSQWLPSRDELAGSAKCLHFRCCQSLLSPAQKIPPALIVFATGPGEAKITHPAPAPAGVLAHNSHAAPHRPADYSRAPPLNLKINLAVPVIFQL